MKFFNLLEPPNLAASLSTVPVTSASNRIQADAPLRLHVALTNVEVEIEKAWLLLESAALPAGWRLELSLAARNATAKTQAGDVGTTVMELRARLGDPLCAGQLILRGKFLYVVKGQDVNEPTSLDLPAQVEVHSCALTRVEIVQQRVAQSPDRPAWEQMRTAQEATRAEVLLGNPVINLDVQEPFMVLRKSVVEQLTAQRLRASPGLAAMARRQRAALDPPRDARLPQDRFESPSPYEIIHSFWLEVAMLAQGIRMIAYRFENQAADPRVSRLANLNVFHLRPAAGLMWDLLAHQHEVRTVRSRVHSGYLAELDCSLPGRAPKPLRPVGRNSSFSAAFHGLLHVALRYHAQHDDKSVHPDGFPVWQALRTFADVLKRTEVNTFARIAFDARAEFATYACILQQPEIRRFLAVEGIPANEPWIPALDALNQVCGWNVGPVQNYYDLAREGERLVSSVRWMDWEDTATGLANAQSWAVEFRNAIQTYCYRMRLVSGLDIASSEREHMRDQALPMSTLVYRRLGLAA